MRKPTMTKSLAMLASSGGMIGLSSVRGLIALGYFRHLRRL